MTTASEQLTTLTGRQSVRPVVAPVSRIELDLTDSGAFDIVVAKAVEWMRRNTTAPLPVDAGIGAPFEVDMPGTNSCRATRIEAADGVVWAGRSDVRHPDRPRREWRTEVFVMRRHGEPTRFGVQLTCITHGDGPAYTPSRPRFVREIIETLSAEADQWPIGQEPHVLDALELPGFVELLAHPRRRLPIVAISKDETGRSRVDPVQLLKFISGAAHVVVLSFDQCLELTRSLGKPFSVFRGAARLYMPGFDEDRDDPYRHPLWLMSEVGPKRDLVPEIARRLFGAVLAASSPATFPTVTQIQRLAAEQAMMRRVPTSDLERLRQELVAERSRVTQLKEDYESAWALALEREEALEQMRADLARAKEENFSLRDRLQAARSATGAAKGGRPDREPNSYDDLEEWSRDVIGEEVVFSRKSLSACRKDGHPATLKRIADALIAVRDYKIPLLLHGGAERKSAWERRCRELVLEDKPCFSDRNNARKRPEYSAKIEDITYVLYDHLKYGTSTDLREAFRIYYAWDSEEKRFVIGSMPHHLDNALTN